MQKSRYHIIIWPRARTYNINTELFKVCFIQLRWLVHPRPPRIWLEWGLDACWHGRPGDGEHDLVFSQFLSSFLKSGDHLVLTNCLNRSSLDHETFAYLVPYRPLTMVVRGCQYWGLDFSHSELRIVKIIQVMMSNRLGKGRLDMGSLSSIVFLELPARQPCYRWLNMTQLSLSFWLWCMSIMFASVYGRSLSVHASIFS